MENSSKNKNVKPFQISPKEELSSSILPTITPLINKEEYHKLELYMKEWEVIIETQMHFNDLILKFRSITLTAFVTLIGATIAIEKILNLPSRDVIFIVILVASLWTMAFVMDFFYYNRLLLGSVSEALKFDKSEVHNSYGLFGLTTCIGKHLHYRTAQILVVIYYVVPILACVIFIFLKLDPFSP